MSNNELKMTPLPTDPEELLALAKEEGVELTEEQLQAIAGGEEWDLKCYVTCENCGAKILCDFGREFVTCPECGHMNGPLIPM